MDKDTLFSHSADGDTSYFVSVSESETLFSSTDIPLLSKQFTSSRPITLLPQQDNLPQSTLFGSFSDEATPPSPVSSILSLQEEITQHTLPDEDDDDVWNQSDSLVPTTRKVDTWESFGVDRKGVRQEGNPFVTEQHPKLFDELLRSHMDHIFAPNESGIVVDEFLFREALLSVCVGRESSLFHWSEKHGRFEPVVAKLRIIGISPVAADSVILEMCRRGTMFRRLASVTENILRSPTKLGSIAVSFARAIVSVTQHWQSQIQQSYHPATQGLLSLESQFSEIDESLFELARLCFCNSTIQRKRHTPLPKLGGQLLTQLYETALNHDYPTSSPLRPLSITLLQHTSSIFLSLLTYWTGLPSPSRPYSDIKQWYNMDTSHEFFIQRLPSHDKDILSVKTFVEFASLFEVDERLVPGFLGGREVVEKVFEMGMGLRLLWRCWPEHVLCGGVDGVAEGEGLEMRWLLSWEDIHETHDRLEKYVERISRVMDHSSVESRPLVPSKREIEKAPEMGLFETKEAAEEMLSSRIHEMSLIPDPTTPDTFITDFHSLHSTLQSTHSIPLLSLIVQNSFHHALEVQSTLIQRALLTVFFTHLDLPRHLDILHSFLLFGNGLFVTKLNEALFEDFDSEDVRAGGQPGLGLGIGVLRKGETWPPSGAKVGVVLRHVLSEMTSQSQKTPEISFAYRELTDSQFDRIKNPIGLEALDFLQIQYKPPFPLDAIITPSILEKYDRIFLFLLRLFRMQYISHQLFRDAVSKTSYSQGIDPLSQRFRIEAHHFITSLSSYIFHVSISQPWHTFQHHLSHARSQPSTSAHALRQLHETCLDAILEGCFLRRRQAGILGVLYGTFETVLLFGKVARVTARREQRVWGRMREEMEDNTGILYGMFVKRVGMFVRVLQGMERREGGGEGFEDLLVRLDGSYFDR